MVVKVTLMVIPKITLILVNFEPINLRLIEVDTVQTWPNIHGMVVPLW